MTIISGLAEIQIDGGSGGNGAGSNQLRILDNGDGASIQRIVDLSEAAGATLSLTTQRTALISNEHVTASFSFDGGATWHVLPNFNLDSSTGSGGNYSVNLTSLLGPGEALGPQGIIKFEGVTSVAGNGNGYIAIDNLSITKLRAVKRRQQ